MRSTASAAARRASTSAPSLTARSGPVTRRRRRSRHPAGRPGGRGHRAQVWSPTATRPAAPTRPATMAIGSSVSPQGRRPNTSGRSVTRGASSAGHHQGGVAVAGQHQHRQPLQRHRLVPGQVRQVGADGQQEDVDAHLVHAGPGPGGTLGEHGRPSYGRHPPHGAQVQLGQPGDRGGVEECPGGALRRRHRPRPPGRSGCWRGPATSSRNVGRTVARPRGVGGDRGHVCSGAAVDHRGPVDPGRRPEAEERRRRGRHAAQLGPTMSPSTHGVAGCLLELASRLSHSTTHRRTRAATPSHRATRLPGAGSTGAGLRRARTACWSGRRP